MDTFAKFANDVLTPYWWLSVVVVGLLINLASAYLKDPLDRWLERRSEVRRSENEEQRLLREAWINQLANEPQLLALEMQAEMRHGVAIAICGIGLLLAFSIAAPSTDAGLLGAGQAILRTAISIVSLVLMIRSIRQGNVHYRNVELAKRLILRRK